MMHTPVHRKYTAFSGARAAQTETAKVVSYKMKGAGRRGMKKTVMVQVREPQYSVVSGVTFAQVDAWFGHTRRDLKMDIIYPEDAGKKFPCVVWICGGAWMTMDRSAHLAYLCGLAREGFVVASVEYRTSNEAIYPAPLEDVKAGIRYLRAYAERYHIDPERIGVMGESAGGYLAAMAALEEDPALDVGAYTEYSSKVQAACPWYPPTDVTRFPYSSETACAASPESLLLGKNVYNHREEALRICPVSHVTGQAPPFLIIHGEQDHSVPFSQGEILHDTLEKAGSDVTLLAIDGADHADIRFFQREIWCEIAAFFREKM